MQSPTATLTATAPSTPSSVSDDPRSPVHTPQLPRTLHRRGAIGPEGFISSLDFYADMVCRVYIIIALITILILLSQAGRRRAVTPYPTREPEESSSASSGSQEPFQVPPPFAPGRPLAAFCFFKDGKVSCVIQHPFTRGAYINASFTVEPCLHSNTCTCQAHGGARGAGPAS